MKDKIYYFQEKSNDVLDLQDEFTPEEIGIIFILKAAYFKYAGELKKDNLCQRCKFFGDKEKLILVAGKIFEFQEDLLISNSWLSEINNIKERSEKRKAAADERWKKENKPKKPKATKKNPEEPIRLLIPDFIETELWNDFVKMRKEIKKPLSETSVKQNINKLIKFENKKAGNANEALRNAIAGSWQGLFEPNNYQQSSPRGSFFND